MFNVYMKALRWDDAMNTMKQLVEHNPEFTRELGINFQSCYKSVIDSIRNTLAWTSAQLDRESDANHADKADFLRSKKEQLVSELLPICRDAIAMIDEYLVPNAATPQMTVFFHKFKGDLYRYVAEYSDPGEADTAQSEGEKAYELAMQVSVDALPEYDPVRLSLVLNFSVFKYDILKQIQGAIEMLDVYLTNYPQYAEAIKELDLDTRREISTVLGLMQQNKDMWDDEREEE